MNLDLGKNPDVRKFSVGLYIIELLNDYDNLQSKLSTLYNKGQSVTTAIATIEEEPDNLLTIKPTKGIWDLCQILSFLSGHSIFTPNFQNRYHNLKFYDGIVQKYEIPIAADIAWNNRKNFSNISELRPFWLYLNINRTLEAEVILLLGCVSLEIVQNIENGVGSNQKPHQLDNLLTDIKRLINESDINKDLKNSFAGVVGKWGSKNSSEIFKDLMIKYGFIDDAIKGSPLRRIKFINKLRNSVVHLGKLEYPNWIKNEKIQKKVALFITTQFIPTIIQEYLKRKFKLETFIWVEINKDFVMEYIYDGRWDGVLIEKVE